MNLRNLSLLIFTVFAISVFSQDSLLIEQFKTNAYELQFEDGKLSGKGMEFLTKIGEQTPFFLIGESHGMAEIPRFSAALFNSFKKYDYRYFAVETGPYTADFLQQNAYNSDWNTQIGAFLEEYPWSLPFFSWVEEWNILTSVCEGEPSTTPLIWGLDQEFAASPRMNFKRLLENAETTSSRQVAMEYYEMAMNSFKESSESKNPGKSFMGIVRPDDFKKLNNAFAGQSKNLNLICELEESIHIYQLWFQRKGYESNRLRAEMMKRHFWNYYSKAKELDPNPKVMFKFGSNHMYRGSNPLNIFDIGNFISELASQMNTTSFHLFVLARKGTVNGYNPFSKSEEDKKKTYDASQNMDKLDLSTILKATPETAWSIVDLRPVRKALFNHSIKNVHPGLENMIWSYDAILVIPEVTASTLFNENKQK